MARYKFVVMTNSCDGREDDLERWYTDGHVDDMLDEFKRWYKDQHLGDVLRVPGFVGAQRFDAVLDVEPQTPYRYLAVYDIETDDLDGLFAECARRDGTPLMPSSDALDRTRMFTCVFRPVG